MISAFVKLLFACAQVNPTEMDIVGELPVELSSTILRYLDPQSLVNAASVNRQWNSIAKSDVVLRKRVHKRLRQERKSRIEAYMKPSKSIKIARHGNVPVTQFGVRNSNVSVEKLPTKYEAPRTTYNSNTALFKVSMKPDGKLVKPSFSKTKKNKTNNIVQHSRNMRL